MSSAAVVIGTSRVKLVESTSELKYDSFGGIIYMNK